MAPLLGSSPTPAAQPISRQDMLARILMGNPDPSLPGYPVMQSAEGRGFAPMPTSMGDMGARMGAVLRGQVEPTPGERYGMDVPLGWVAGSGGSARDGIRAYHGSPHQFDRFDMSRIGTGEGAQAYGHGLYFAGNEGVAHNYRTTLSGDPTIAGRALDWAKPAEHAAALVYADGSRDAAIRSLEKSVGYLRGTRGFNEATHPEAHALQYLRSGGELPQIDRPGSMYEVRLNTTPDRLLDWDAPYQRQPPNVQGAMADVFGHENLTGSLDKTIGHRFGALSYNHFGREGGDAAASSALREAGIPGIQYLDQGSRATSGGELLGVTQGPKGWQAKIRVDNRGGTVFADPTQQITTSRPFQTQADAQAWADGQINGGTRNYVMFDDKLIDILRRYGLAGMLTGGAASQAQTEE